LLSKRTTLILGAGASKPYGFPIGVELRDKLLDKNHEFVRQLNQAKVDEARWNAARRDLLRSQFGSIDDFLARYPEHAEVTKIAIAYELNQNENTNRLLDPRQSDHWYKRLFVDYLGDGGVLGGGRLRVVTFNYDLSLEAYLFGTLLARTRLSPQEAVAAMKMLPIVHVYGELGQLASVSGEGRSYGRFATPEEMVKAGAGISTCHEENTREAVNHARQYIEESEVVAFLGFGFSRENLALLNLEKTLPRDVPVLASVFKCPTGEEALRNQVKNGGRLYFYPGEGRADETENLLVNLLHASR
jgi:hypothetical protein